jgi:autophagy-related protein 9
MSNLHPNIHREDKIYENGSSDDEVPQSFMIEATSKAPIKATLSTPPIRTSPHASPSAALNSTPKRVHIPLPAVPLNPVPPTKSVPARTSDQIFETPLERMTQWSSSGPTDHSVQDRPPKPMRELDAYERALWNWVNVYNLDAFLQEIYYYYEGKGIYSIALARGLNLLSVIYYWMTYFHFFDQPYVLGQWDLSLDSRRFC